VGHALAARPDGSWRNAMIRFFVGCLLFFAVLWVSLFTFWILGGMSRLAESQKASITRAKP
jgi:hypothetical protein